MTGAPTLAAVLSLLATVAVAADASPVGCGRSPSDWCSTTPGDPCGVHKDAASCRADAVCFGVPYRGESVVACQVDERGFASNCPTVGCTSTAPKKQR